MSRIVYEQPSGGSATHELRAGAALTIGRDPDCDVVIPCQGVSMVALAITLSPSDPHQATVVNRSRSQQHWRQRAGQVIPLEVGTGPELLLDGDAVLLLDADGLTHTLRAELGPVERPASAQDSGTRPRAVADATPINLHLADREYQALVGLRGAYLHPEVVAQLMPWVGGPRPLRPGEIARLLTHLGYPVEEKAVDSALNRVRTRIKAEFLGEFDEDQVKGLALGEFVRRRGIVLKPLPFRNED